MSSGPHHVFSHSFVHACLARECQIMIVATSLHLAQETSHLKKHLTMVGSALLSCWEAHIPCRADCRAVDTCLADF